MLLKFRRIRCKITNLAFKNRINEFIYLMVLSLIITKALSVFVKIDSLSLYVYLIALSAVLSITSVRPSNCVVFSVLTRDLGMSIKDLSKYHSYDYYEDREAISELFKKECIEGITNLSKKPYAKKMRATTHKWVYENILCIEEVLKIYEVKGVPCGKIKVPQEVLTLNSNESFVRYKDRLKKSAYQERDKYKVTLERRNDHEIINI